jgi:hypothetical protein
MRFDHENWFIKLRTQFHHVACQFQRAVKFDSFLFLLLLPFVAISEPKTASLVFMFAFALVLFAVIN